MRSSGVPFVVVDASLVMKWYLPEAGASKARTLLASWLSSSISPIAPVYLMDEVVSVLHRAVQEGAISLLDAQQAVQLLPRAVQLYSSPLSYYLRAMEIAAQTSQKTTYDALYLTLAEREGCDLWTADAKFANAAAPLFPQVRLFIP